MRALWAFGVFDVLAIRHGLVAVSAAKCRPGCKSAMPTLNETRDPGFTWWDLYNVSHFVRHTLGHDLFIFSMPTSVYRFLHREGEVGELGVWRGNVGQTQSGPQRVDTPGPH